MGWPEFKKCCGCVPLPTAIVLIGCWIFVFGLLVLGNSFHIMSYGIKHNLEDPDHIIPIIGWVAAALFILKELIKNIIGILIIVFRKNAKRLKRLVFYIIAMCVAELFILGFGLSTLNTSELSLETISVLFQYFFNAFLILVNFYFIFIIRSTQLQLERNTDPIDDQRRSVELGSVHQSNGSNFVRSNRAHTERRLIDDYRQTVLQDSVVYQNNEPHLAPPPYEEAVRQETLVIYNVSAPLSSSTQDASVDERERALDATSIEVDNEQHESTNTILNRDKKEPECVIYDEEQFMAIRNARLVERSSASNE